MAKKPQSFKVDTKKNIIVLYTNVKADESEQFLIDFYLNKGFMPRMEEKKKGKTVEEMKKDLNKKELDNFEKLYQEKNGFHNACKYYNACMKANKMRKDLNEEQIKEFDRLFFEKDGYDKAFEYYNKCMKAE